MLEIGGEGPPPPPLQFGIIGLRIFFTLLLIALITTPANRPPTKLFLSKHGRSHRLVGAANLVWLIVGSSWLVYPNDNRSDVTNRTNDDGSAYNNNSNSNSNSWAIKCLIYDIILGLLGTSATLTAAKGFPHRHIINRPGESGTLSHSAMVTQNEMLEHAFYQMLNLWQALYLHAITWMGSGIIRKSLIGRMALLWIVTLPWVVRTKWFPVNSFSANWTSNNQQQHNGNASSRNEHNVVRVGTKSNERSQSSINRVYQIKKWQYVFYKHVILHGLNISMAVISTFDNITDNLHHHPLPLTTKWRTFWLCLNTSYVRNSFYKAWSNVAYLVKVT